MMYWESKERSFLCLHYLFIFFNLTGSIFTSLVFMLFNFSLCFKFVECWEDDGHMNDLYELRLPFWAFWLFFRFICFIFRSRLFRGWDTVEISDFTFFCFNSCLVWHLFVFIFSSFLLWALLFLYIFKSDFYEF